jgi:hypothetical protein
MGEACSAYGKDQNAYEILVGKPEEKRRLGPGQRWGEGNDIGWADVD